MLATQQLDKSVKLAYIVKQGGGTYGMEAMEEKMDSVLPNFTVGGVLPPGDYELTLEELKTSMLVRGPANRSPGWDEEWRLRLVDSLEVLVRQLWEAGIT